jgi:dynactin complex subunit
MIPENNTRRTQDHLFAVEPALKEILSAPFRAEWEAKTRKLEKENLAYNNKNYELEKKLKDALSANASLNKRYLSTADEIFELRRRVHKFCEHNLFRRLWIAFRNDLTP